MAFYRRKNILIMSLDLISEISGHHRKQLLEIALSFVILALILRNSLEFRLRRAALQMLFCD